PYTAEELRPAYRDMFGYQPMKNDLGYYDIPTTFKQFFLNKPDPQAGIPGIPGYAQGGRPAVGEPAIVGENGPEVFVPDVPGTVVPQPRIGGMFSNSMLDPSLQPLFMQSAMVDTSQLPTTMPPSSPGLSGYEQYDPQTLGAMRIANSARPAAGRY